MKEKQRRVKEYLARLILRYYFILVHRVRIDGLENIPVSREKLIIVANHGSLLDGPLLWAFLPLRFKSLISIEIARLPLLRTFLTGEYVIPVSTLNSYAVKSAVQAVVRGTPVLLFPEGQRSRTGGLMKIYEGAGFIAYRTGARILPVYLENSYAAVTSRSPSRKSLFVRLRIVIGKAHPPFEGLERFPPRRRRKEAADRIYDLLTAQRFAAAKTRSTLGCEFIRLCRASRGRVALKDISRRETGYFRLLAGAFLLGGWFAGYAEKNIGIALPNVAPAVLLFAGLQLFRKVPVLLNYALGPAALRHMMRLADLRVIVTSRAFLEQAGLDEKLFSGRELVFLEDVQERLGWRSRALALWHSAFPGRFLRDAWRECEASAVILFTSGSEGAPKGVCLTHENILVNIHQCLSRLDIRETDYLLNALPLFHSFGLTVGTLLPLFAGARVYLYISPLHYRNVPETVYSERCTILIGTNTFLNGYRKKAHPYDFNSLRYVYCGAEALQDRVFEDYARVFGVRVMSGYGATECSPVISMNNALACEYGSVGKFLPGMRYRLIPEEGLDAAGGSRGRLLVKGRNVMKGYLGNSPADGWFPGDGGGWYDTGDIAEVSETGFVRLIGRKKRFAKVSGEMVSLGGIEEVLEGSFGDRAGVAVIAVPDEKRGERVLLVADSRSVALRRVRDILRARGIAEIAWPKEVRYVRRLPRLGTGKIDYRRLRELVSAGAETGAGVVGSSG